MRKVLIVLGIITVLSLVGALTGSGMTLPGSSSSSSTTQLSGPNGNATKTSSNTSTGSSTGAPTTVAAIATPTPVSAVATPTPLPVSKLDTQHQALVLLNPSSARPGST